MRRAASVLIAGALLVSASSSALADDEERWQPRREIGFGMVAGGGDAFAGIGPRFEAGFELGGQLHLLAAYDYAVGSREMDQDGVSQRAGLRVQHPLFSFGSKRFRSSFLASAGAGWQQIDFEDGVSLSRPDVQLALNWSYDLYWSDSSPWRMSSVRMGFLWRVAKAPRMAGPPGCDGPCTAATAHHPIDTQFLVTLTFTAGKW